MYLKVGPTCRAIWDKFLNSSESVFPTRDEDNTG